MTATLTERTPRYLKFHDRETGFYREYRVLDLEKLTEPVRVRLYQPAGDVFCVVRAGPHHQGSGRAGGSGRYHKASAALSYAISNAGIDLSEHIDGVGDAAMDKAILAIAAAFEVKHAYLITVNA